MPASSHPVSRLLAAITLVLMNLTPLQAAEPVIDTTPVPMADPGSRLDAHWRDGPFMQVFVRSYQDSDGDGIGDLRGLTRRLDHLQSLGVRGLWLMPIQPSQDGDHGYAVKDYRAIEPDYGTLADFDELLRQAHARGIGVIIDYVINHSAADHPLFRAAEASPASPWRDWYVWSDRKPAGWQIYGNDPWYETDHGHYFAGFWSEMPDFNLKNPAVVAWHHDNLRWWLNRGVDGFRFDAVGNLVENGPLAWESQPESVALMADVAALVHRYERRYLVCEAPGDPVAYARACGAAFAFGHNNRLVSAAMGSPTPLEHVAGYFERMPAGMATFASNHDSFAGQRLMDRVRGDEAAYRLVAATYLLQPGTPFIYYGEEIGMAGGAGLKGDPKLRATMSWDASAHGGFSTVTPYRAAPTNAATHHVTAQQDDASSLLSHYRALIALRNSRPSLRQGAYEAARTDGWLMTFQRTAPVADGVERTLVVYNFGTRKRRDRIEALPPGATLRPLWRGQPPGNRQVDRRGRVQLDLAPQSLQVWSVEAGR
ncbi:alpha-amylase family glycosyl hydrolase [Leptothrix sp. BB-4]